MAWGIGDWHWFGRTVTIHGVPSFQLVPLCEDDDLIDSLLEHNPAFRETLRARLNEKSVSAKDARRRL